MDKKRSVQIVKDAKAEIKKLQSHRPSTPFSRNNSETEVIKDSQTFLRPSSSTSTPQKYEYEESCSHLNRKLLPLSISKKTTTGSKDVKLEPIISKPSAKSSKLHLLKLQQPKFIGFPPIADDEHSNEISKKTESDANDVQEFPVMSSNDVVASESCNTNKNEDCIINPDVVNRSHGSYASEVNDQSLLEEIAKELAKLLPYLEKNIKLGRKKREDEVIEIICKIYQLLSYNNAFDAKLSNRVTLLKHLFKLLDTTLPALSFHIVKLLFQMKIKDKNLSSVFRLILKLMNGHKVDLCDFQLIEPLLDAVENTNILINREASLYGVLLLKRLIFADNIENELIHKCAIILFHHLRKTNDLLSSGGTFDEICKNIVTEVISTLHSLAFSKDVWKVFHNPENISEILKMISHSCMLSDIVEIIVRLISKIVDEDDGAYAFVQCHENLLLTFIQVLEAYKYCLDIILQSTFIVGNLVSVNEMTALLFLTSSNFKKIIMDILEVYVKEHIQFKGHVSEMFKKVQNRGDRDWHQDIFEVISKILCILANVCLSTKAGQYLSKENNLVLHLLDCIAKYTRKTAQDARIPLYSFLVVINNITYYLSSDSSLCIKISERVIPLLDDNFEFEVRFEAANITQNLTRSSNVRKFIQDHSLLPAFVKLLSEDDKEFNVVSYGIIMNLLLDPNSRQQFYEEQGLTRVLHKLHLCAYRDWKMSALLCQILWNYCGGENAQGIPISKMELQHLIKYLSYSIYNEKNDELNGSDDQSAWRNEFCPVAKNLLQLLQSKTASPS